MKWRIAGGGLRAVIVAALGLALAPALAIADVEPNNTVVQAEGPLAGGTNIDGVIATDNDVDFYFFNVSRVAEVKITLATLERGTQVGDCCSSEHTKASIYKAENDPDGEFDRSLFSYQGSTPDQVNVTLDPGRYIVVVSSQKYEGNRYRVRIEPPGALTQEPPPPPSTAYEPNNSQSEAFGPLAHGQAYAGAFSTDNDVDWFRFNTGTAGPVTVNITNPGPCDVSASVYDGTDDFIDSTTVTPDSAEAIDFTAAGARQHFVALTGDCVGGQYVLAVTGVIASPPAGAGPPPAVMPAPSGTFPAKFQVLRSQVENKRLDMLVDVTDRANGDEVEVEFHARGRRYTFTERIENGRLRFKELLPSNQRSVRTGIVTLRYAGNERVRPDEVRLRAASRKAELRRSLLSLENGVLIAEGRITGRARGVVRLRLTYDRPDGTVGAWDGRATIRDSYWSIAEALPAEAQGGGYLSIQFTGYQRRSVRGEQIAKELLNSQVFETD